MWFRRKNPGGMTREELQERIRRSAERAANAEAALERGELPRYVYDRAKEQLAHELPWTSDLTVSEWAVLSRYKLRPLGLVMGCCVYHLGTRGKANAASYYGSYSFVQQEQAMYDTRALALHRLSQEAALLGANAVVGVELEIREGLEQETLELRAFGTAIVVEGLSVPSSPLLCTVSGQDLVRLLHAGSMPVGLAMGVGIYYQQSDRQDMWQMGSYYNQEMYSYSDAVYQARHRAITAMKHHAADVGGNVVLAHHTSMHVEEVEVEVEVGFEEVDSRTNHIVEFFAMGTIVSNRGQVHPERPQLVVSLNDSNS
ncbi:MAG: heavy metal-binding domain-containing protein [Alicyclobacillaceae bacterium]|uniref:heavy metal-binding domain-containing protein n=1 Tax=Alicyclobacillus sp. SP_1 TaxID=2942475 RepID=UPI002157F964|nr:heavy metal-binding domain-containing protein [Alicyclobacillus sp. SP_1]MCY0887055.1 heavy metal-binding domain-containing protein [Alicyclobacillaceae bacterium]MCY0896566.1 heavy metal-binding domain-containing protein [Alicyclobacillaceae bacterium]